MDELQKIFRLTLGERFDKWLEDDPKGVTRACYLLQGRARTFTTFLQYCINETTSSPSDILNRFLAEIIDGIKVPFPDRRFWNRVFSEHGNNKLTGFSTGVPTQTPDLYLFDLLFQFLIENDSTKPCMVSLSEEDADLVHTALVSLRLDTDKVNYYLTEPVVIEAALCLMRRCAAAQSKFMKFVLDRIFNRHLSEDAIGKMLDRIVALRFRLGWWGKIPFTDPAWQEIPADFCERVRNMKEPKFIFREPKYEDHFLALTFLNENSNIYVLIAEKSGLDGCFRFIGYLGKTSFTPQNHDGGCFISAGKRKKNMLYTDINQWFGSFSNQGEMVKPFLGANRRNPMLFICAELPFHGPSKAPLPGSQKLENNNWVIHLDFMLGQQVFEALSLRAVLSESQRGMIPKDIYQ